MRRPGAELKMNKGYTKTGKRKYKRLLNKKLLHVKQTKAKVWKHAAGDAGGTEAFSQVTTGNVNWFNI